MKSVCSPLHRSFAACGLLLAAGLFLTGSPARAFTPASFNDPATLYTELQGSDPESRTCAQYVLEAYADAKANKTAVPDSNITNALTMLRNMQDLKSGSATYGNFAWSLQDETSPNVVAVNDQNAGEFVVQALAQVPLLYGALESQNSSNAAKITQILTDALTGINNHSVAVTYTNIAITKSWNLVALGQVLPNATALEAGRDLFDSFLDNTRAAGITEFLSPTYYASDMDSLGYLYLYAQDREISSKALQALRLFWIDLYANWYAPDERMGGAHSRTYDFLKDNGSTDKYYYAAGLISTRTPSYWRALDVTSYSVPAPADVPGLFTTLPLRILRTFTRSGSPYSFTTNYIGAAVPNFSPGFTVGSTTTDYGDVTSELLTINLPINHDGSTINANTEGRGDPYLQNAITGKTSVAKAVTLKPFVANVQRGAEVLYLSSSDGSNGKGGIDDSTTCVESSLIFPNEAEIWLGTSTTQTSLAKNATLSIPAGLTVFFRINGVATGVRFLQSTNMTGATVGMTMAADGYDPNSGQSYYAKRITCVHDASKPTLTTGRETFAYWTRTAAVADDNAFTTFRASLVNAAVTNSLSNGVATLSVPGQDGQGALAVTANVNNQSITSTSGAEPGLSTSLVNVNGTDYVTPTLQQWVSQDIGTVGTAGSSSEGGTGGIFTVNGAGSDIWGTADSFQFCYQKLHGNGTVIARLISFPSTGVQAWAKAGVMMRETLAPGSTNAIIEMCAGNGERFSKRQTTNAASTRTGNPLTARPVWFKVVRSTTTNPGDTFTGYTSPDGVNWTVEDAPTTINMAADIYVGVAVTSYNPSATIQATFDNLGVFPQ